MDDEDEIEDDDPRIDDLAEIIGKVLSHVINEPVILARMEQYLSPKPASLSTSDEEKAEVTALIHSFTSRIDGNGRLIITKRGDEPERLRTYHADITRELIRSFHTCHTAVCRAHMSYITLESLRDRLDLWMDMTPEAAAGYAPAVERYFWEALEIATIRLTSFWDRVGQLLDYVFFNIRQYERDGFPAVLDRIKKNFAPGFPELSTSADWKAVLDYSNSEKPHGFRWLARRRNFAVHSTAFRPYEDQKSALFEYEFNHFEARVIRDLALKAPKEELEIIHAHLAAAADLFRPVFRIANLGLDIIAEDVGSRSSR